MKKEDIEIGMKVVPHQKTAWGELSDSYIWRDALDDNQNYLFVVGFDEDENCFVLSNEMNTEGDGDYFNPVDFDPYVGK